MGWLFGKSDAPKGKPKVLIVDDELENQLLAQTLIQSIGADAMTASSGGEALSMARAHKPALILLDIVMPVMDGLQTLERLKKDSATKAIPVFMVSSRKQDFDLAVQLGAKTCIYKPYNNDEFTAAIRAQLGLPPTTLF